MHFVSRTHRVDDTLKLRQHAIALQFYDAASMGLYTGDYDVVAELLEGSESPLSICMNETRVADHICRQAPFHPLDLPPRKSFRFARSEIRARAMLASPPLSNNCIAQANRFGDQEL